MVNRTVDIQFLAGRALTTDLLKFYLEHNTLLPRHRKMAGVTTDSLNKNRPANILCSISFPSHKSFKLSLWRPGKNYKFLLLAYSVMYLSQAFEPSCQAATESWLVIATNQERLSLKVVSVCSGPFQLLGIKHTLCKSKNHCLPRSIGIRFILLCMEWTRSQFLQKKEASSC